GGQDHFVERTQLDRLARQKQKTNRVPDQFFLLGEPKVCFRSCRLRSFLYAGDIDQQRDQVLRKIDAAGPSLIVEEIEPVDFIDAKETTVTFSAGRGEVRTPEIRFVRFKTEAQSAES